MTRRVRRGVVLVGLVGVLGLDTSAQSAGEAARPVPAQRPAPPARVTDGDAPGTADESSKDWSDWWIGFVTLAGPFLATWAALRGQAQREAAQAQARGSRVQAAIHREITSNVQMSDSIWDVVGPDATRGAEALAAAERLQAQPLPVWERDAYRSLLAELPDAVGDAMAETAEHYGLLRRMDARHRQLLETRSGGAATGGVTDDDERIRAWLGYAEARRRLAEIGNPLDRRTGIGDA